MFVDYLVRYATASGAPVETGVRVARVTRDAHGAFRLETSAGPVRARAVVVATGAFGDPVVPAVAAALPVRITQMTTDAYRSPGALPPGGVLVVAAASRAARSRRAGARRARDVAGRGALGLGTAPPVGLRSDGLAARHGGFRAGRGGHRPARPRLSFTPMARWGTADFHLGTLAASGVRLLGRVLGVDGERLTLATDVSERIADADAYANAFLARVHAFAAGRGQDLGPEPPVVSCWEGRAPMPAVPVLDLAAAGISTVIWSTGYRHDLSWLALPGALAATGAPYQRQGCSTRVARLAFVGLHRMWTGGSGTVLGVGVDAISVADTIADQLAGTPGAWPG